MELYSLGRLYPYQPGAKAKKRSRATNKVSSESHGQDSSESIDKATLTGGPGFLSKLNKKFGKIGVALCLLCAASGAAQAAGGANALIAADQFQAQQTEVQVLDNKAENQILKESQSCGEIVHLKAGVEGQGAHLTIHGLGASPKAVKPLNDKAASEGKDTSTFVYKDIRGCDHRMNSEALAEGISEWASQHPNETLTIETHSQGGRIGLGAFRKLINDNEMPENKIEYTMVSPPLGGFSLANLVLTAPGPLARLIPGAAPTRDMASWSGASRQVRNQKLPSNVETKIVYGSADRMVNYNKGGHQKVAKNLDAEVFYIADGTHTTTVPALAENGVEGLSSDHIPYQPANKVAGAFLF